VAIHCVREKVNSCIRCHNSGKQCQILTEFWTNNEMSNCKEIDKFKWNLNACNSYRGFSEVTPKTKVSTIGNCTDIWLSKCTSVQISNQTSLLLIVYHVFWWIKIIITKVCVQNVLLVLECKLEDVDGTAWSLHRWTPGGNVPTLRWGVTSAGQRHAPGCDASPRLVVYRVQVRTVGWPQSWSDEVWCFTS